MTRDLDRRYNGDRDKIVAAYAVAERCEDVQRASSVRGIEPEECAEPLCRDGVNEGRG